MFARASQEGRLLSRGLRALLVEDFLDPGVWRIDDEDHHRDDDDQAQSDQNEVKHFEVPFSPLCSSEHVHSQHQVNEKQRDQRKDDVAQPLAGSFGIGVRHLFEFRSIQVGVFEPGYERVRPRG